jgi:hypothetical protein
MSKVWIKGLGMALVGLAVPLMSVGSAAAAPGADEVSSVELACLAYFDISTCTHAVSNGVGDVVENDVNGQLADQGVDFVVDVLEPAATDPGSLGYDINAVAVNPLPPVIPVPPVPGVPFQ